MLSILNFILGGILLLTGRKLFWLLVGVIGFVIGVQLAARFFNGSQITMLIAGLVLGVIGALLAVFLESVAIGLVGFLGGGYILLSLATLFNLDKGWLALVIFIVGGVIGSALIAGLLNWALIIISSLAGASMMIEAVQFKGAIAALAFVVLLVIGLIVQSRVMGREEHPQHDHRT